MPDKKTICFIAPKAYPLFNPACDKVFGGAEVDLYYLATEFAKDLEYKVKFIVADYGQPDQEIIENTTLIKSLSFSKNIISDVIKIWNAMKKADCCYYFIKTTSMGTFLAALFCKLHKRAFIYRSAHSTHCDGSWIKKHPLKSIFYKWAVKNAKYIFTQNQSDSIALKNSLQADSISLPNGHRIKADSQTQKEYILWTGRSANFKQPEIFLKLAQANPQHKFVMICQKATNDSIYSKLKDKADTIENLTFVPRVPFHEINSYFSKAKVFVNTSTAEGYPNTFIQACLNATPILSLNVNPDMFLDKYNCGICTNNESGLSESLELILSNYKLFSDAAFQYALDNHNITEIIKKYKSIIV